MKRILISAAMIALWAGNVSAQPTHGHAAPTTIQHAENVLPHPSLSSNPSWAGPLVIVILGLFFGGAAVIGPIVRMEMSNAEPDTHAPDAGHGGHDPHASHGHGH